MNKRIILWLLGLSVIISGCGNPSRPAGSASPEDQQWQRGIEQTSGVAKKAQVLLAQAKQNFSQGKFDEAITIAQKILVFAPDNMDALRLIDAAKLKLEVLAKQKPMDPAGQ